jgi:hypothetical protein
MTTPAPTLLDQLEVRRLDSEAPAAAACFSLPVPPSVSAVTVAGIRAGGTPVAWWNPTMLERLGWRSAGPEAPRRLLMTVASDGELPDPLQLAAAPEQSQADWGGPAWSTAVVDSFKQGVNFWEAGELVFTHGKAQTALRLGLEHHSDGLLWWEWLEAEELWCTPACKAIRCGGYIPATDNKTPEFPDCPDKEARNKYWRDMKGGGELHHDNWIFAEALVLLFANGVIQVTARHINGHMYNRWGEDLAGILPVVGVRGTVTETVPLVGEAVDTDLGTARLSTQESRSMASAEQPGKIYQAADVAVLRACAGISVPLDSIVGKVETGRPYADDIGDPERQLFPNGMARTVRFCLSLGEAPPRVARYVLPPWWYGMMAELCPDSLLPVADHLDSAIDSGHRYLMDKQRSGCFDDGSVLRYASKNEGGWEGETPYNLLRCFYRRPSMKAWERALSCAYNFADIAVHHVDGIVRMHGYDSHGISPTMNRSNGLLQAYLETGDPYLLETCEKVAATAFNLDTANWPRRSVGRDAMYIRGLILLDDYLPGRGYGQRAREALRRLTHTLTPAGCVVQQGGTAGFHARTNEGVCVWQNFHVLEPVVDWLERHPTDDALADFLRAVCDWLCAQFVVDGDGGWWHNAISDGENTHHPINGAAYPSGRMSFAMYAARSLLFAARHFDMPAYLEVWERALVTMRATGQLPAADDDSHALSLDHAANKSCESLAWHQLHRWRARWVDGQLTTDPYAAPGVHQTGTAFTPDGPKPLSS